MIDVILITLVVVLGVMVWVIDEKVNLLREQVDALESKLAERDQEAEDARW